MRPGVNLIPAPVRFERLQRRRVRFWRLAVLAVWAAASVPVLREVLAAHQLNTQRSALTAATAALHQIEEAALDREARLVALRAEIARADELRYKRRWGRLLNAVAAAMPDSVWLVGLATDPPEPVASAGMVASITSSPNTGGPANAGGTAAGSRSGAGSAANSGRESNGRAGAPLTAAGPDGSRPEAARAAHGLLIGKNGPRRLVLECRALVLEDIFRFVSAVGELGIFHSAGVRSDSVKVEEVQGVKVTRFTLECGW